MKISLLITLAFAFGAPTPDIPGVLRIPIHRRETKSLSRRSAMLEMDMQNTVYSYFAHFKLGSNKQPVHAQIDTGSSDLWVYSSDSGAPQGYNPETSETSNDLGIPFAIEYVTASTAGDFYTDQITVGGVTIEDFQFAVVPEYNETSTKSVFGVGFASNERSSVPYHNFPEALKAQGIIERNAYSLFLDSRTAKSGHVLYGGVDMAKYEGELTVFDFLSTTDFLTSFTLAGQSSTAVLDSGSSLTYVDPATFDILTKEYPGLYKHTNGFFVLDKLPKNIKPLVWEIGGGTITVPGSELFLSRRGKQLFTIQPNTMSRGLNIIGDSTLRSAYVVYDLDGHQGAIAQAKYTSDSNVIVIKEGLDIN